MLDLRKHIAHTGGKTISRKARSSYASKNQTPATSPGNSRAGSRPSSRPVSRYASDNEGASDSDPDSTETGSAISASESDEESWRHRLLSSLEGISVNRKRGSLSDRVDQLEAFLHVIRHHYTRADLDGVIGQVVPALLRSIKSAGNTEEQLCALRALGTTILTCSPHTIDAPLCATLKVVCEEAENEAVKAEALRALAIAGLYAHDDDTSADEILEFLISIVQSDGKAVEAEDSGVVVSVAMNVWAFVAAHHTDLSEHANDAMEAFVEQLDSIDAHVQTGAASNIAFLFEASREHEEETGETLRLGYDPKDLSRRLVQLSRGSQSVSRKNRRHLRTNLSSVVTALDLGKGPRYSTAQVDTRKFAPGEIMPSELGYRERIRVGNKSVLVDSWSLMARLVVVKKILGGGFPVHFIENPTIIDLFSDADLETSTERRSK